jgi:site-specific DNA recombinase
MIKRSSTSSAVGYVRRSTDRQEQSIDDQKKILETFAQEQGIRLNKFYVDDAISGTYTLKRKAFLQMISDAERPSKKFDSIIVYDVKRFGRVDNDEAGYYRHRLKMHGVQVLYVTENFNGDCTDDLLRPVKQWQARQESKDLSKVTIRGLLSKADTGYWMGGVPPYGYDLLYQSYDNEFLHILRFMPDGSKQVLDKDQKLVRTLNRGQRLGITKKDHATLIYASKERVEIAKRIFKMYAEIGKGFKAIAHTLNDEQIESPRGSKWSRIYSGKWAASTTRAIIVNPIYAGDMVWNRRTDARFHRISKGRAVDREQAHGHRLVPNDETDWIIVRDAHPAIISRRLFQSAKDRLDNNISSLEQRGVDPRLKTHGKTWNGQRSRFILSGLLKCSLCGNRYQGVTRTKGKKRIDGSRVKTYYYGCGGYITKGTSICKANTIPKEVLESKIIETVLDFYRSYLEEGGRQKLAESVKAQTGVEKEDITSARQRAQAELENITKIVNNLLDNITETNREHVDKRLNELTTKKQQIETRLEELKRLSLSQAEINTMVTEGMQFLAGLEFTLHNGLPQEKLAALRQCIEKIHLNKPDNDIKLLAREVPVGNLQRTEYLGIEISRC